MSVNGIGWTNARLVRLESTELFGLTGIGRRRVFYLRRAEARTVPGFSRLIAERRESCRETELIGQPGKSADANECRGEEIPAVRPLKDRSEKVRGS